MTTTAPFVVRGPLQGQGAQAEAVMRALPGWFGVEESIHAYAKAADEGPTHVAEAQGTVIGFVTLPPQVRPPSKCSSWRC